MGNNIDTTSTKLAALLKQEQPPAEVKVTASFHEDDNTVDVNITLEIPSADKGTKTSLEGTQDFTIQPNMRDGFTLVEDNKDGIYFSSPKGDYTIGELNRIKLDLRSFQDADWFKRAILEATFTRNKNLKDEQGSSDELNLSDDERSHPSPSVYLSKLHILQDCLDAVIRGIKYDAEKHFAIAGFLINLPPGFWQVDFEKDDYGLPFGEVYFTYFLMQEAWKQFVKRQGSGGKKALSEKEAAAVSEMYQQSLAVLDSALKDTEFEEYCENRWLGDLLENFGGGIARCDLYDKRKAATKEDGTQVVIADPFVEGSAKTVTEKILRNTGKEAVELALNSTADAIEDGEALNHLMHSAAEAMENNPEGFAKLIEASDSVLQDQKVKKAVSSLSGTLFELGAFVADDPELALKLQSFSQELAELSLHLIPDDPKNLLASIEDSGAVENAKSILSAMLRETLAFSEEEIDRNHALILSQAQAIALLGLEAARSQEVQNGLEESILSYLDFAVQLFNNEDFKRDLSESSQLVTQIMLRNANDVLSDEGFRDELAFILSEQIIPYCEIFTNAMQAKNQEALAVMLSSFVGSMMEAELIAFDTPEYQRSTDRLLDILPMLKEKVMYLIKTPFQQKIYNLNKPKRFLPTFKRNPKAHENLVLSDQSPVLQKKEKEFVTYDSVGHERSFTITYQEHAKSQQLPNSGITASINLSDKAYDVDRIRKILTDIDFRATFFKKHAVAKDFDFVDIDGNAGTRARLIDDEKTSVDDKNKLGNKCSFIDIQGRPHYLTTQEIIIKDNPNEEYLLDMWVDHDRFFYRRRGEMIVAWDVIPTDDPELKKWREENGFDTAHFKDESDVTRRWREKNHLQPEHVTNSHFKKLTGKLCERGKVQRAQNAGIWQIIDEDGDGIVDQLVLGVSLDGASSQSEIFRQQVFEYLTTMALMFEEYPS